MDLSERMQIDRYELGSAAEDRALRVQSPRAVAILNLCLVIVAIALVGAAVAAYNGWAHAVVIGGIAMTAVGLMIAVAPRDTA